MSGVTRPHASGWCRTATATARARAGARRRRHGSPQHGIEVRSRESTRRAGDSRRPRHFADGLDLVISLGGDGTMLRTVDLVYEAGVPVLGVNVGQLGYLTEVEPADLDAALDRLLAGDYEVDERMVLEVTVESAGPGGGPLVRAQRSGAREGAHRPPRPARGRRSTARSSRPTPPTA